MHLSLRPSRFLHKSICERIRLVILLFVFLVTNNITLGVTTTIRNWDDGGSNNDWTNSNNWGGNNTPDGTNEGANFGAGVPGDRTIGMPSNVTVEQLNFNTTHNVTIADGAASLLIFQSDEGGPAEMNVQNSGNFTINENISLNNKLVIDHTGSGSLTINGNISGGQFLTKDGSGTTTFTGAYTYTGETAILEGTATFSTGSYSNSENTHVGATSGFATLNINNGFEWTQTENFNVGTDAGDADGNGVLNLDGTGTTLELTTANGDFRVGLRDNTSGTVNVTNNAQLVIGDKFDIGGHDVENSTGDGWVNVQSGADVSVGGNLRMGNDRADSTGILTVDGNGSTLTVTGTTSVGMKGTGSLTIQNGGDMIASGDIYVGEGSTADGDGSMTVTGNGSTLTAADDVLWVGYDSGEGRFLGSNSSTIAVNNLSVAANTSNAIGIMTIQSGSDISIDSTTYIGRKGTGSVVVNGTGSTFNQLSNGLNIGQDGGSNGLLEIQSGAVLTASAASVTTKVGAGSSSVGTFNISGNGTTALLNDLIVGDASAGSNAMTVSSSAVVTNVNNFTIADDANSNGIVTVVSGGNLSVSNGLVDIGASGTGSLSVSGANSAFSIGTGSITVGDSNGANGYFELASGATLTATSTTTDLRLGENSTSIGSVLITGSGTTALVGQDVVIGAGSDEDNSLVVTDSAFLDVGDNLTVGNSGKGAMTVSNGADVEVQNAATIMGQAGTGSITLTGSGSSMNTSDIWVGNNANGSGYFKVESGALLTNNDGTDDVLIGRNDSAATGTFEIVGNGTTALLNRVSVGDTGSGDNLMIVSNTATVTVADTFQIGDDAGSNGTLSVLTGGDLTLSGAATLGDAGTGIVTVNGDGSTLTTSAGANIAGNANSYGSVTIINGGDMVSGSTTRIGQFGTGSITVTGTGSTLTVSSNGLTVGQDNGSNGSLQLASGALLTATHTSTTLTVGVSSSAIGTVDIVGNGTTALLNAIIVGDASTQANVMNVSNSAVVTTINNVTIADDANSNGSMTVETGGQMTVSGTTTIGNNGTGSLVVTNVNTRFSGQTVNVGEGTTGIGTLTLSTNAALNATTMTVENSGSTLTTPNIDVGTSDAAANFVGVSNSLTITDTATATVSNSIFIGNDSGETGTMTVSNDADLTVTTDTFIGNDGTGTLTVTGTGTTYNNTTGDIIVGHNSGGKGVFTLSSGTVLTHTATTNVITIGENTGSLGSMTVSNAGTTALLYAINVGQDSTNNNYLEITDTAVVTTIDDFNVAHGVGKGTAVINNDATLTIGDVLDIGVGTGSEGVMTILGGADVAANNDVTHVGQGGTGTLIITGSGTSFTNTDQNFFVGNNSGSNGLLRVAAGGQLINSGTTGQLVIGNDSGSIGSVDISGNGTTAIMHQAVVGSTSAGANELVISETATVTLNEDLFVGFSTDANGRVTVETGADITVAEDARIGQSGTGTMTVTGAGTTMNVGLALNVGGESGSNGQFTLSNGAVLTNTSTSSTLQIGRTVGSIGSMTIDGSGTTALLYKANVGDASAGDNMLVISDNANVSTISTMHIGDNANSNGTLTLSGGADLTNTGFTGIGYSGTGRLMMTGTGTTFTAHDSFRIAHNANSFGVATVTSGASVDANKLYVGGEGTGSMTVTGSGTSISVIGGATGDLVVGHESGSNGYFELLAGAKMTATAAVTDLRIGQHSGSVGSVLISGAGTTATFGDTVFVGVKTNADNTLVVSNSAEVTTGSHLLLANDATSSKGIVTIESGGKITTTDNTFVGHGGTGLLTIKDANSKLTTTNLLVGNGNGAGNSIGTVSIENGAEIETTQHARIGQAGSGTLTVAGTNSKLTVGNDIYIGAEATGVGVLNINAGGVVDVADKIYVGNGTTIGNATVNLNRDDGIINGAELRLAGGTFNTGGNQQAAGGLADLTLTTDSIIDMGNSDSIINWTVIDETTWTGTLKIYNWTGTRNQTGGTDQLIFTDITGFDKGAQVWFYDNSGTNIIARYGVLKSIGGGRWELIPAPEASTYVGVAALLIFGVYFEIGRRRRREKQNKNALRVD